MIEKENFVIAHLSEYKAMISAFNNFQSQIFYEVEEKAEFGIKTNPTYIIRLLDFAWRKGIEAIMPPDFSKHYLPYITVKQIIRKYENKYGK